jgi:putative heme transporter
VLLVALRDVGISNAVVNWVEVLAVFAFARLATAIPFTHDGGGLVAAVHIYRALIWLLPVPIGVGTYLRWWRRYGRRRARRRPAP